MHWVTLHRVERFGTCNMWSLFTRNADSAVLKIVSWPSWLPRQPSESDVDLIGEERVIAAIQLVKCAISHVNIDLFLQSVNLSNCDK